MTLQNVKISLRTDALSNWTSANPILKEGELAIVNGISAGITRFKVGNGISSFLQLPYVDEIQLSTQNIYAKSIAQGLHASAVPYGLAAGAYLSANANFSQAFGYNAETQASDSYSFVWNGDDTRALGDYYQSHGPGTFNINTKNGVNDVWIGNNDLWTIIDTIAQDEADHEIRLETWKNLYITKPGSSEQVYLEISVSLQPDFSDSPVVLNTENNTFNVNDYIVEYDQNDIWQTIGSSGFSILDVPGPVVFKAYDLFSSINYPIDDILVGTPIYVKGLWYTLDENTNRVPLNSFSGQFPATSIPNISSDAAGNTIYIDDRISGNAGYSDLSVIKLSANEYEQLVANNDILSNAIYIVDNSFQNVYGQQIKNLAAGTDLSDAVNVQQLNDTVTTTKTWVQSQGYLTAHQSLTAYYNKTQVNAISTSLSNAASSNFYNKTETSSSTQLANALSSKLEPNEVSISYNSNAKKILLTSRTNVTSVDCADFIKDGMLSSAELCGTTLVLKFNTDAGSSPISVQMSSFVDNYDGKISSLSTAIDDKVYIDGLSSRSLSVTHIGHNEFYQKVIDDALLSNEIYIVSGDYINAYGQQIKNIAPGVDLSDAVNVEQLNTVSSSIPTKVSQLSNDSGYTTNVGTITGITMNGASKGTSGNVNLGTVLTAHQSLSNCLQNNSSYDSINLTATGGIRLASDVRIDNGYGFTVKDDYQDSYTTVNLTGISIKEQILGELDDQTNIGAAHIAMSTLQPNQQPPSELFKSITFTTKTNNTSQTSSLADLIYTKTETSSATEISTALANAGGGSGQLSTKLDSSAAWPDWIVGVAYNYKQIVSHNGKLWKANAPGPSGEPGSDADWLSVDINSILTSQYQTKGNYLTAVPTTYKTYSQTVAALSNDGYATLTQVNQKSTVSFNRITTSGTNIGSITIDGTTTQIYAPTGGGGGGSSVQVSADYQTGTRVATISVDNVPTSIYVPNGGGGGSSVQVSANYQSGINIATISVDSVPTSIYVPNSSGGSSRYALVTAQLVSDSGSLTCAVDDQTITTIQVSSSATPIVVQLPAQPEDGARDFILRIEISSSAAPTFTFNGVNETIDFDSEDADWAVMEPGLNLVSFTETKRGN